MNYRSVNLCQEFLDRWKHDLEQGYTDGIVNGRYITDDLLSLYKEYKKIETEYYQDLAMKIEEYLLATANVTGIEKERQALIVALAIVTGDEIPPHLLKENN